MSFGTSIFRSTHLRSPLSVGQFMRTGLMKRAFEREFATATPLTVRIPPSRVPLRPSFRSRAPRIAAYAGLGVLLWTGILSAAFNYQRRESSIVAGTYFALQHDSKVQEYLGKNITWEFPTFPWIHGTVNYLKGIVQISFRIKGDKGAGLVFFESRRNRQHEWKTRSFHMETDEGLYVKLDETGLAPLNPHS